MVNTDDCWLYAGQKNSNGYGQLRLWEKGNHLNLSAHRLMYEKYKGEIPPKYEIDHLCFTPPCINPDHLEAVTRTENIRRTVRAGRNNQQKKTHCPQGHEYNEANTEHRYGFRYCIPCHRARYHKKKELKNNTLGD